MDNSGDPDDEVGIDPLPIPSIPIPRTVLAIRGRLGQEWLAVRSRSDGGLLASLSRHISRPEMAIAVDCAAKFGTINSMRLGQWRFSRNQGNVASADWSLMPVCSE